MISLDYLLAHYCNLQLPEFFFVPNVMVGNAPGVSHIAPVSSSRTPPALRPAWHRSQRAQLRPTAALLCIASRSAALALAEVATAASCCSQHLLLEVPVELLSLSPGIMQHSLTLQRRSKIVRSKGRHQRLQALFMLLLQQVAGRCSSVTGENIRETELAKGCKEFSRRA